MLLNEPGCGHRVFGELYEVDEVLLKRIDMLESSARRGVIAFKLSSRLQQMDSAARLLLTRKPLTSPGPSTAATWMTIRIDASFRRGSEALHRTTGI